MDTATAPVADDPFAALRAAAAGGEAPALPPAAEPVPAALTGALAASVAAPALAVAAAAPARAEPAPPRFAGGKVREASYPLDYPVEYDGKLYAAVTLRRPNSKQVGDYFEHLQSLPDDASTYFPVFYHEDGEAVPAEVLDFLDGADFERIMERLADFLPPRLQRVRALTAASTPGDGAATEPKS